MDTWKFYIWDCGVYVYYATFTLEYASYNYRIAKDIAKNIKHYEGHTVRYYRQGSDTFEEI